MEDVKEEEQENEPDDDAGIEQQQKNEDRVISYYENESPFVLGHFINWLCDVLQVSADDLMATTPLLDVETQRLDTILITKIIRAMNIPDPKKKTLNQIIDAYLEEYGTYDQNPA